MHDVIVVGGGPAGNLAARELARRDYDVLVLEDHRTPGQPQHCTGLITDETISMSGVRPDILNTLYGAEVIFPNGKSLEIRSDNPKGKIVDRIDLDIRMAEAAMNAGAQYSFLDKYKSHSVESSVLVESTTGTYRAKAIVGADGVGSAVAMSLGDNRAKEYVRGIQADIRYTLDDQSIFKLFIGNNVAPGFFGWAIPCGDMTRIGLCTTWAANPPSEYLSDLLIKMGVEDRIIRVFSGKIPIGGRPITYGDRCLLAGDAAGFVKPVSGGGLYPAFTANKHLIKTLSTGLDSDSLNSRDLIEYEKAWKGEMGRELDHAYSLRKRYRNLSDMDFNKIYDYAKKNNLQEVLADIDIDHPGSVLKKILYKPSAVLFAIPLLLRSIR
jgi:geranylgeranyl reductase family protein